MVTRFFDKLSSMFKSKKKSLQEIVDSFKRKHKEIEGIILSIKEGLPIVHAGIPEDKVTLYSAQIVNLRTISKRALEYLKRDPFRVLRIDSDKNSILVFHIPKHDLVLGVITKNLSDTPSVISYTKDLIEKIEKSL